MTRSRALSRPVAGMAGMAGMAVSAGWSLAMDRMARRGMVLLAMVSLCASLVAALIARQHDLTAAPSQSLSIVLGFIVPVLCFLMVGVAVRGGALGDMLWSFARHGLARRYLAIGAAAAWMVAASLAAVLCVALALFISYQGSSNWAADLMISAQVAVMAACSYVALFVLGSTFGRRGGGRWLFLLLDLLLGTTTGTLALIWPRAHVTSLLGGASVFDLPQRSSSAVLIAFIVVLTLVAALRWGD